MKIFISYRRDDSSYATSSIFDHLVRYFGEDSVFMDVSSIPFGVDFRAHVTDWISGCDVVLVIIGERWLNLTNRDNVRRIDDPHDYVRLEIEAALARSIPVVPVLVGAEMPRASELPTGLRELTFRNAVFIQAGRDFTSHVARLVQALESLGDRPTRTKAEVLPEPISTERLERPTQPETSSVSSRLNSDDLIGAVFISYRREGAAETARLIRYELMARRWRVFLDVEDLGPGEFDDRLLLEIENRKNFVLVLAADSLERCHDERDWLRREITHAIGTKRNVVPFLKEGCPRPDKQKLVAAIEKLSTVNCVNYSHEYYDASILKLVSFLKAD